MRKPVSVLNFRCTACSSWHIKMHPCCFNGWPVLFRKKKTIICTKAVECYVWHSWVLRMTQLRATYGTVKCYEWHSWVYSAVYSDPFLSCSVSLESVLLISCVFRIFFSERWQSTLFQIFFVFVYSEPSFIRPFSDRKNRLDQLSVLLSLRAHLHVVGMLRFMPKTSTNRACPL